MFGDQVVGRGEQRAVGSIRAHDEGSDGARDILIGNIHGDAARVGCGMAGGHYQLGGICGIGSAERSRLAGDAGIELAVGGIHREPNDRVAIV